MKKVEREDLMGMIKGQTIADIDSPMQGMLVIELGDGRILVLNGGDDETSTGIAMFPSRELLERKFAMFKRERTEILEKLKETVDAALQKYQAGGGFGDLADRLGGLRRENEKSKAGLEKLDGVRVMMVPGPDEVQ